MKERTLFPADLQARYAEIVATREQLEKAVEAAVQTGEEARRELAQLIAAGEYYHPECQAFETPEERRAFCFEHGEITAKAVLLIHGWTSSPYEMRELGSHLYQQGHNVMGIRLAGHGTSSASFSQCSWTDWLHSARIGLAAARLLGNEVIVVGESMGGSLAVLLANEYPTWIEKLILCAPCFQIANRLAPFSRFRLVRKLIPVFDSGPEPPWMQGHWYTVVPTTGVAELVRAAAAARRSSRCLKTATLIIQAANDAMVNPAGTYRFFKSLCQVPPAHKRIIVFPDGHHNLTVDANPQKHQVFQWIREFIQ